MYTQIESNGNSKDARLVIVKYFLDRAGYGSSNSSARFWKGAPSTCKAVHIQDFLDVQGLLLDGHLLVEVYLDKYEAYMTIDLMEDCGVFFDFSETSAMKPGILNLRLTDLNSGQAQHEEASHHTEKGNCTLNPIGLFAFSLTVILETADLYGKLFQNSVDPSFILTWGPYAFFVSGLLQLIAGLAEMTRNNIYGATAFLAFGSFWLANGLKLILMAYFPEQIPDKYLGADPWGNFIRNIYIMAFVCVLFKQTLIGSKLSSLLIGLLIILLFATALNGFYEAFEWIQMIFATLVSLFAFYVFTAEFTNEVYGRQVFHLYPWKAESPQQVFAAAGRTNMLQSEATKLRAAKIKEQNFHTLRAVQPTTTTTTTADEKA